MVLGLDAMLKKDKNGIKHMSIYPAESYKETAIICMLKNGVDILKLMQLTGLSLDTLLKNFDINKRRSIEDLSSNEINKHLAISFYYSYL